jgi:hypothetical protein
LEGEPGRTRVVFSWLIGGVVWEEAFQWGVLSYPMTRTCISFSVDHLFAESVFTEGYCHLLKEAARAGI